ncbi:MAG: tetratricopeptide repeat protein [Prevotella sp.]|nr:tetratricopeptide repeat protein [Prevotella sp.]
MKTALLFLLILFLWGCDTTSKSRLLDEVDSLVVAEKYDSAYHKVLMIKPKFFNERDMAHYKLLLTQTSYLTDNTLPTDSTIDDAIKYYEFSDNDVEKLADAYYYKASCLHERNDATHAIQYYKKAEETANKSNNLRLRFKIAESMVRINNQNGNYSLQLNYARKALGYAKEAENKNWIAYSYFYISRAFQNMEKVDSLTKYTKELILRLGDIYPQDLPHFLNCIGFMYIKNGDLEQARKYFEESLSLEEIPNTLVSLAEVYTEEGNDDEAYKLWQKAFLMDDDGSRDIIMFNMLQYDLKHHRNLEDACERMYRIYAIKDSITNTLKDRTIQEMQQKYDEQTVNHIYESKLMRWMIATLILILLVLLMAGYVTYRRYRSRLFMARQQMLINQYNNEIIQLTTQCNFAEQDIYRYKTKIVEYTNQIHHLKSSGECTGKQMVELIQQKEVIEKKNEELESICKDARQKINELEEKIKDIVENNSHRLNRGKILYDDIDSGKTTVNWSKDDFICFVEYFKALNFKEFESICKDYKKLTYHNMFYLILQKIGKDDKEISKIMGISHDSIRTYRHRLLKKQKTPL